MAATWVCKLSHARLTLSPFSSEQMMQIGEIVLRAKQSRISQALDSNDSPAKALVDRYARRKITRGRAPVRDWNFRGVTMRSVKVKSANENRVIVGPTTEEAVMILTAQRRLCEMWSDSPRDTEALHAIVRETLRTQHMVKLVRSKVA